MTSGIRRTRNEIEEIVGNYNYSLLDEYIDKNHHRKVIIKDSDGYKYDVQFDKLWNSHYEFSFVSKGNPFSLENIDVWTKKNNKNFELILARNDVFINANEKLNFYCLLCEDCFSLSWKKIYEGRGCLICAGWKVTYKTSLAYLEPELSLEWIKSENNKTPETITRGSNKNVLWKCKDCNHEWWSTIINRTLSKNGCPKCSEYFLFSKH